LFYYKCAVLVVLVVLKLLNRHAKRERESSFRFTWEALLLAERRVLSD